MFNKNSKALIYRTLTRVLAISLLLNTTILGQNKPVISESLNLMTWDNTIEESPNTRYLSHDEKTILLARLGCLCFSTSSCLFFVMASW